MGEVDTPDARRSFLVRQHLGNYALWSSGMFPDRIEHKRWRRGGPDLDYFEEMGRRGFTLAAEHRLAQEHGLDALLRVAASRFAALQVRAQRGERHAHVPERELAGAADATGAGGSGLALGFLARGRRRRTLAPPCSGSLSYAMTQRSKAGRRSDDTINRRGRARA